MPIYTYVEINPDGSDGAEFEFEQPLNDPPLARHPLTGAPLRRVYSAPGVVTRYSDGEMRRKISDEASLAAHGFTRYERDPATGVYHKTAGTDPAAPETFSKPRGNELLSREANLIRGENAGEHGAESRSREQHCSHGKNCSCGHCH